MSRQHMYASDPIAPAEWSGDVAVAAGLTNCAGSLGARPAGPEYRQCPEVVEVAIGGKVAGQVYHGDRRFDIVVRLPERLRTDIDGLERIPVPLAAGGYIPLGSIARVEIAPRPSQTPSPLPRYTPSRSSGGTTASAGDSDLNSNAAWKRGIRPLAAVPCLSRCGR